MNAKKAAASLFERDITASHKVTGSGQTPAITLALEASKQILHENDGGDIEALYETNDGFIGLSNSHAVLLSDTCAPIYKELPGAVEFTQDEDTDDEDLAEGAKNAKAAKDFLVRSLSKIQKHMDGGNYKDAGLAVSDLLDAALSKTNTFRIGVGDDKQGEDTYDKDESTAVIVTTDEGVALCVGGEIVREIECDEDTMDECIAELQTEAMQLGFSEAVQDFDGDDFPSLVEALESALLPVINADDPAAGVWLDAFEIARENSDEAALLTAAHSLADHFDHVLIVEMDDELFEKSTKSLRMPKLSQASCHMNFKTKKKHESSDEEADYEILDILVEGFRTKNKRRGRRPGMKSRFGSPPMPKTHKSTGPGCHEGAASIGAGNAIGKALGHIVHHVIKSVFNKPEKNPEAEYQKKKNSNDASFHDNHFKNYTKSSQEAKAAGNHKLAASLAQSAEYHKKQAAMHGQKYESEAYGIDEDALDYSTWLQLVGDELEMLTFGKITSSPVDLKDNHARGDSVKNGASYAMRFISKDALKESTEQLDEEANFAALHKAANDATKKAVASGDSKDHRIAGDAHAAAFKAHMNAAKTATTPKLKAYHQSKEKDFRASTRAHARGLNPAGPKHADDESIENPNSSGQGNDPDHAKNPFHSTLEKSGWKYSHTTKVNHNDGPRMHHTYKNGDHNVSVVTHKGASTWDAGHGGSGRSTTGSNSQALVKHLAGVKKRGIKPAYGAGASTGGHHDDKKEGVTEVISAEEAMEIAGAWHNGRNTALYVLSNTGAIQPGIEAEIDASLKVAQDDQKAKLESLRDYVEANADDTEEPDANDDEEPTTDTTPEAVKEWVEKARALDVEDEFPAFFKEAVENDDKATLQAKIAVMLEVYKCGPGKKDMARKLTAVNPMIKQALGKGVSLEGVADTTKKVRVPKSKMQEFVTVAKRLGVNSNADVQILDESIHVTLPATAANKLVTLMPDAEIFE